MGIFREIVLILILKNSYFKSKRLNSLSSAIRIRLKQLHSLLKKLFIEIGMLF